MTLYKLVYFVEGVKCTLHTDSKEYYESVREEAISESNTPDNSTDENVGG